MPLKLPVIYSLELTSCCTNDCVVCPNLAVEGLSSRLTLHQSDWFTIIDRISASAAYIKLTGGEPTLHPDFAAIIHHLDAREIPFVIFTNGLWTDREVLLEEIKACQNCCGLLISLHGADAEAHESYTRRAGSFSACCDAIQAAVSLGLTVNLSTVITAKSAVQIEAILALAGRLGITRAIFNRLVASEISPLEPDPDLLKAAIAQIRQYHESNEGVPTGFGNCFPACFTDATGQGCWAGLASCTIDPGGNVRPCSHSSWLCGNILQTDLETIWNSQEMNAFRAIVPDICTQCAAAPSCRYGCKAIIESRGLKQDPLCAAPFASYTIPKMELELPRLARPSLNCKIILQGDEIVLARGHSFLVLKPEARPVLEQINESATIGEIVERHGQKALDLLGHMFVNNLIK